MKWPIVGLVLLGLVAAVGATLAARILWMRSAAGEAASRSAGSASGVEEVSVLVAAHDLEMMEIVDAQDLTVLRKPRQAAPSDGLQDPVQVIGKILSSPVVEGQPLRASDFLADGARVRLARALPDGMRAMTVPLQDPTGLENLLYPGCIVDVLSTMTAPLEEDVPAEPHCFTLLENVMVLAFGDQTIVSQGGPETPVAAVRPSGPRNSVTVLVDPKQAERLSIAMREGSLSLALRNPQDTKNVADRGTRVTEMSILAAQAAEAARMRKAEARELASRKTERQEEKDEYDIEKARDDRELWGLKFEKERTELEQAVEQAKSREAGLYEATIYHGATVEKKSVAASETQSG